MKFSLIDKDKLYQQLEKYLLFIVPKEMSDKYKFIIIVLGLLFIAGCKPSITGKVVTGVTIINSPPDQVMLYSLANNSQVADTITFQWNNADDLNRDQLTYQLMVDDGVAFDSPLINITNIAETLPRTTYTAELSSPGYYYWKVRAFDGEYYGIWSSVRKFQFSITPTSPSEVPPYVGGMQGCVEWECTEWSECSPEGIQTRKCTLVSDCQRGFERPEEERKCKYVPPKKEAPSKEEEKKEDEVEIYPIEMFSPKLIISMTITWMAVICLIIVIGLKKRKSRRLNLKKELPYSDLKRLKDYIKKGKKIGYSEDRIKRSLLVAGWPEEQINLTFNELDKLSNK